MDTLVTLCFLVLLQAVLGFDNLLYISLESKRVAADRQPFVRKLGIGLAIGLRIVLLVVVVALLDAFRDPFLSVEVQDVVEGRFNLHALIVLAGGVFVLYTAVKEIYHMLHIGQHDAGGKEQRSVAGAVFWIVLMNLVFSFDSLLSAMALTKNLWVIATAIVLSGVMMMWLSDRVSQFLQRNRMYEVLGLFILLIVGVMLLTEGGHLAHLTLFGEKIEKMSTTTFYFVISVLVITDLVQSRYQRKLIAEAERQRQVAAE